MSSCSFASLAAGMAMLNADGPQDLPPECADPVAFYVVVTQNIADGYEVEHLAKVCYEHERRVSGLDGYQQSRKIRIRS